MNAKNLEKTGKFMSLILRHDPKLIGIDNLELGGYVSVDALLKGLEKNGHKISREELDSIVESNNKQRYSYDASRTRIRANQGHSVDVDLQLNPSTPPDILYHGTVEKFLSSIKKEGLKRMARHAVHLSSDIATAENVGGRRGEAIVLEVDAKKMNEDGYVFYCSENGVWLTDAVPSQYIRK